MYTSFTAFTRLAIALTFCLFCKAPSFGQSRGLVSVAGAIADDANFILTWNIGEAIAGSREGLLSPTHYMWVQDVAILPSQTTLDLKVYPTLITESLNLQMDEMDLPAQLQLFSLDGKLLLQTSIHSAVQQIHLPPLRAAVYIVKVTSGTKYHSAKLIKP